MVNGRLVDDIACVGSGLSRFAEYGVRMSDFVWKRSLRELHSCNTNFDTRRELSQERRMSHDRQWYEM